MLNFKLVTEIMALSLMIAQAYLAFKAKREGNLNEMVWSLAFMLVMGTCIR